MPPPPLTLTFDLLTLKVVLESRVTWANSVPILSPMYATGRQTDVRQHHRLMLPPRARGHNKYEDIVNLQGVWHIVAASRTACLFVSAASVDPLQSLGDAVRLPTMYKINVLILKPRDLTPSYSSIIFICLS